MSPSKLFTQIAFGWWFLVFSLLLPTEISMKTMAAPRRPGHQPAAALHPAQGGSARPPPAAGPARGSSLLHSPGRGSSLTVGYFKCRGLESAEGPFNRLSLLHVIPGPPRRVPSPLL